MSALPVLARRILLAAALVAVTACFEDDACDPAYLYCEDEDSCTPAPASCKHSRPSEAALVIQVSNPLPVLVRVYRGPFEEGVLVWSGPPQGNTWSLNLPLGDYSATALYVTGADSALAVDGDEVTYSSDDTCDGTCFSTDPGKVDLRLE